MVQFAYYGERWKEYLVTNERNADDEYHYLSEALVAVTGHENINDEDGKLISREQREKNYRQAVQFLNGHVHLGMDADDIEIMTLVYTALSEVPRFGGDVHMDPVKGENTGTHSLHTTVRANLLIRRALKRIGQEESKESVLIRQLTGLCLVPHDIGESIGEPGSLAQEVSNQHMGFKKDKPAAEKLVLNSILRLAAHAVESKNYQAFYDKLDKIKMPDIASHALVDSNEVFLEAVRDKLGIPPEINMANEGRVAIFTNFWDMLERHGYVPNRFQGDKTLNGEFISQLASLCEHVQGTGHFNKFSQKESDPERGLCSTRLAQSARVVQNMRYVEGEVGHLFAAAHTPLEKAIALEAKREVYKKCIDFISNGPAAVNRSATNQNELLPNFPSHEKEIEKLVQISAKEGELQEISGNTQAIRNVETRERLIAIYQWAREHDEFETAPGQILIEEPPEVFRGENLGAGFREKVTGGARPRIIG